MAEERISTLENGPRKRIKKEQSYTDLTASTNTQWEKCGERGENCKQPSLSMESAFTDPTNHRSKVFGKNYVCAEMCIVFLFSLCLTQYSGLST